MKSPKSRLLALCLVILAVTSPPGSGQDAPPPKKHPGKLGSLLSQLADAHEQGGDERASRRGEELGLRHYDGEKPGDVTVLVEPLDGKDASSIDRDDILRRGGEITGESESFLRVKVPVRALRRLSAHVGLRTVRTPTMARALEGLGANLSESVALTGASSLQLAGSTGAGVKIAVVDLGFIGLASTIAAGELPANTVKVLLSGQSGSTFLESVTNHGCGVSEHVADMAPGAQIFCIRVRDDVDLQNAATYCKNNGIRIANHSVGWVNASYYDGSGPISSIINTSATSGNVLWCVAAGNDADRHWRGAWTDTDSDGFLDLGNGVEDYLTMIGSESYPVQLFLNWNQYGHSTTDLDLYVYNRSNQVVANSTAFQSGTQLPTESVSFTYSAALAPYRIRVYKYTGSTVGLDVTLFSFNHSFTSAVASSSLMDPACAPGAFAVGAIPQAIYAQANPALEYYSSQGPTNDGRLKPDIAAPDGTTSLTYGFQASFGTSFASPTTAGAAALLLQRNPSLNTAQLAAALRKLAIDVGPPGPDPQYGAGKLALTTNAPPVANAQSVTTAPNTPVGITLTGSDPTGDPITFELVTGSGPFLGVLSGTAPNLTYTPNSGVTGSDSFMFRVDDGITDSAPVTVSLSISAGNRPPVALPQSVSTLRDTPVAITLAGSDPDGNPLTYAILAPPSHGGLSGAPPAVTYTPAPGYFGADAFTFRVNDGTVSSAPATVSITVIQPNTAPVANDQSVTTNEDTSLSFALSASDADGDPLSFAIVGSPTKGGVVLNGAVATYTPNPDVNGTDSFTFKVNDGSLNSNLATVTVTITPVNDAPVAQNGLAVVNEDAQGLIPLQAFDVDSAVLTYSIVGQGAKGVAVLNGSVVTYTPNPDANGTDVFTFKVNDGALDSNIATVTVTINPINDPPTSLNGSITTLEDTAVVFPLSAADVDGDALAFVIVSNGAKGTVVLNGGVATYTPNANANGTDSFTFKVNDGQYDSNVATVVVTITPVNDPPVALSAALATAADAPLAFSVSASDVDGDALTYSIVAAGTKGGLVLDPVTGAAVYTPNPGASGTDTVTFRANDGTLDSNIATLTITIASVNHVPTASDGSQSTDEDVAVSFPLSASDPDGDALVYSIVAPPSMGTVTVLNGTATYTPFANANGTDQFTFKAADGQADSNVAVVTIVIAPVNDPPVALPGAASLLEDSSVTFTLSATDVDSPSLTYVIVSGPTQGTLSLAGASATYTPNPNANGTDSFTFQASDGSLLSNIATVTISIGVVNDPPVANAASAATNEDTPVSLVLTGGDPDGDVVSYAVVGLPSKGVLSGTAPNLVYTPNANVNGTDSFTFKVSDGQADSALATITLTINPVNDPPVAHPQSFSTPAGTAKAVTLVGDDVDGDALTYTIVTPPSHGTLTGSAPNLTYTSTSGYYGPDSFTFTVSDGSALSAPATVSITTTPQTLASDGFESANFSGGTGWTGAWTTSGDIANVTTPAPHTGTHEARLRRNTGYMKRSLNVAGLSTVRVKFSAKGASFEAGETGVVLVSFNGTTWTTLKTFTQAEANNTWRSFDLPVVMTGTTLWVAFDANMSGTGDNWYIDDVSVTN
ncbi:MAG TPA: Ig-like domain-containing protein [Planctomycetota bacterium]|nr:Ig-like domain-containing protein [Planctomycetota bacterium]